MGQGGISVVVAAASRIKARDMPYAVGGPLHRCSGRILCGLKVVP